MQETCRDRKEADVRKSVVFATIFVVLLVVYAGFTSNWHHVYYIAGSLGFLSLVLAIFHSVDKRILGERGRVFSKKERPVKRTDEMKRQLGVAILFLFTASIAYLIR